MLASSSVALMDLFPLIREPVNFPVDLVAATFVGLDFALDVDLEFASSTTLVDVTSPSLWTSGWSLVFGGLPRRFAAGFCDVSFAPT